MSAISWAFAVSGDWSNSLYWNGGVVPGAGDDVTIDAAGSPYTVTLSMAEAAHSLTLDSADATASLVYGGTLTLGGTLDVAAGKFKLAGGTIEGGTLMATGGVFAWSAGFLDGVTVDGALDLSQAGSHLAIGADGVVVRGAGGTGPGVIDVTGAGSTIVFEGTQSLDNATVNIGAGAYIETNTPDHDGKSVLTLGANAEIDQVGLGVLIAARGNTIVNNGLVNAEYAGGEFYFGKSYFSRYPGLNNFTNHGVVHVGDHDRMTMDTFTVVNDGSIGVDSGGVFADTFGYVRGEYEYFDNAGNITVAGAGAFYFSGGRFTNTGTIQAEAGSTISLQGNVQNSGVIIASHATVTLYGQALNDRTAIDHSRVTLGGQTSGGELDVLADRQNRLTLDGTLSNGGHILEVGQGAAFGIVTVEFGQINGGTITDSGGGFVIDRSVQLGGVTFEGVLTMDHASSRLEIGHNGVTLTGAGGVGPGTLDVSADNCQLVLDPDEVLDNATIRLGGLNSTVAGGYKPRSFVTLGPHLSIEQTGQDDTITGAVYGGLVNEGVILAGVSGGTLTIDPSAFSNQGRIAAYGGGAILLTPFSALDNLRGSTLTGGTFEADAGSSLTIGTPDHQSIVSDAATIVISGLGSVVQTIDKNGSSVGLESSLTNVAAGGGLELLDGRGWSSAGALSNAGVLQLGGGTFAAGSLANSGVVIGFGTISSTVTNTGVLSVDPGQLLDLAVATLTNLAGGVLTGGIWSVGAGATLQLTDDTSIAHLDAVVILNGLGSTVQGLDTASGQEISLKQSLATIGAAGVLELLAGRNFAAANAVANMGRLQLAGGTWSGATLTDAAGSILTGFGAVASTFLDSGSVSSVGGALAFSGTGDSFAGALSGTEIDFTGGTDLLTGGASLGAGAVGVSGESVVTLGASLAYGGALTEANGASLALKAYTLTLSGVGTTIDGTVGGGGTLAFTGGTQTLGAGAMLSVAHWSITGGTTTIAETLGYKNAFTLGAGATLTLTSGDKLNLTGAAGLAGLVNGASRLTVSSATVSGLALGGTVILEDAGSVTQTGAVTVGDASASAATLTIDAGATWTMAGGGVARGTSTRSMINVEGTFTDTAAGTTTVAVKITDTGSVVAAAGLLNLIGALSGTGVLTVDAGAGLEAANTTGAGLTLNFAGGNGLLALAAPGRFAATIAGFDATDTIDLVAITATSATLGAGDTLVIRNGSRKIATLQLSGDYAGDTFTTTSDGAGGTNITLAGGGAKDPPAAVIPTPRSPHVHSFVTAMAGIGPSEGAHGALAEPVFRTASGFLAAPRIQTA